MFRNMFILAVMIVSLFPSCGKEKELPDIKLPPTPILSISSRWGVITSTYLRMREKPDINSRAITTLWKGYILEVVSRNPELKVVDDREGHWYQVTYGGLQGWVFSAYVKFFSSRDEAERNSRELRE